MLSNLLGSPSLKFGRRLAESSPSFWFYFWKHLLLWGKVSFLAEIQDLYLIICHFFEKLNPARLIVTKSYQLLFDHCLGCGSLLVYFLNLFFVAPLTAADTF